MIDIMEKNADGKIKFACLKKDIPNLPTKNIANGSTCIAVDLIKCHCLGRIFIFDKESEQWKDMELEIRNRVKI